MPYIDTTFKDVENFFTPKDNNVNDLPENIRGIWSLSEVGNMSILMSFNNADFDPDKRRLVIKLYEPGNWLFRDKNCTNETLMKLFKYSYQFDFNEAYDRAEININLGSVPVRFPQSVSHWTVDLVDDKMIRSTKIFGSDHKYEAARVTNDEELSTIHDSEKFFYC